MSLLSNLLAFSSLNHFAEKQQRSASASNRFLFESDDNDKVTEPKQRVVSKSLSKMGLLSNSSQSKIDPKYRCLHRIVHNLSMKVRKQYYGFFVTLQTIKKNKQNEKNKQKICPQKLQNATAKINQTFSIRDQKVYENSYKEQMFKKIKSYALKAHLGKTADKIYLNKQYNFCCKKLFRYFNEQDKLSMKFELIQSAIQPVLKKFNNYLLQKSFQFLEWNRKQALQINSVKQQQNQQILKQKERRSVSIFDIFDSIQKKSSNSSQNILEKYQSEYKKRNDFHNAQNNNKCFENASNYQQQRKLKKQIIKQDIDAFNPYEDSYKLITNQRLSFNIQPENFQQNNKIFQQNKFHSLQASPNRNYQNKNKSPYATSKKILNLKQSVAKDSFQFKSYQKVYKCYQISLNYDEKPYYLTSHYESMPKMMHKMTPQEFAFPEVQDLADKSNIFRDFQNSKATSCIDNLEISSVVGEPFMRAETLISDIQRNREKYETNSMSQISYAPFLPHQASMSSINQREESNFGCDAVNFKNSLVLQRQSMKKTQRQKVDMFIKKKTLINSNDLVDHQSQQLKNLRNRRKNNKQFSDRKTAEQIMSTAYEQNYQFQPDYLIKRQTTPYQYPRSNNLTAQLNYNNVSNWEIKKSHHQYNSEGKNKSLSFNSNASELIPRRLRYDGTDFEKKANDDSYVPSFYSATTSFRDTFAWKGELIQNRSQMPVRDVGMDPFAKLRTKNSSVMQSQTQINKDIANSNKKFINISKR